MTMTGRPPVNNQDDLQATLNYALGNLGGKQKSWMVNPPVVSPTSAPVGPAAQTRPQAQGQSNVNTNNQAPIQARPRGRPRKHPVQAPAIAAPQQLLPSSTSNPSQPKRAPPPNSISPQLPNVVSGRPGRLPLNSHITVFSSPSPSEATTANVYMPPSHDEPAAAAASPPHFDIDHFLNLGQLSPVPSTQEALERMAVDDGQPQQRGQPQHAGVHAQQQQQQQQQRPTSSTSQANGPTRQQADPRGPALGQFHTSGIQPTRRSYATPPERPLTPAHLRSQAPPPPVRTQSSGTNRSPPAGPVSGFSNPAPPSSNALGPWYTPHDCWTVVQRFEAAHPLPSGGSFQGKRLSVLKDAIQIQDWAYLTLHQYSCLMTLDPMAVPQALRAQPKFSQALDFVQHVLGTNAQLSPACLQFFAYFPASIDYLGHWWPAMFGQLGAQFLSFVTCLPDSNRLKHNCSQRRFPPLAHEMSVKHGIASPVFQRLLFTSCLRWICRDVPVNVYHAGIEAKALAVLEENRNALHRYQLTSQQGQQQEPFEELFTYGQRLRNLLVEYEGNSLRQASLSNPQHAGSVQSHLPQQHPGQRQACMIPGMVTPSLPSNVRSDGQQLAQVDMQQTQTGGRLDDSPASQLQQRVPAHLRRPPLQSNGSAPSQAGQTPAQPRPSTRVPLLPPPGWLQPQQRVPNPARYGLHQAHLRSPTMNAKDLCSPLYYFFQSFKQEPKRLSKGLRAIETMTFTLSSADMRLIAHETTNEPGYTIRDVSETSKTIRLRCIKWFGPAMPTEQEWAIADTTWIPYSYFRFNDTALEQRRKVHYGKDQPIDLTHLVREGPNTLEATIIAPSTDTTFTNYLIAIEILGLQSHDAIKKQCLSFRRIPAAKVLATIKAKLSGPNHEDNDDDVAIVDSTLTISLRDPFSASSMCTIPVRGISCAHSDCFDLDTFLETRPRAGDASRADVWRCPICNMDARPGELLVDGFLEEVKRDLEGKGLGGTRAIEVGKDGTWKVKAEVREGVSDESPEPGAGVGGREVEIIDLSD
ncbi:hypothetical protein NX059_009600 [Plenodomus lindquistii]|nr:hypothetical protein NX059_009600 [Plenodomus lindquistii]